MKRIRESISAVLLLVLIFGGAVLLLSHPRMLLNRFFANYQAARPENPSFVQKLETAIDSAEETVNTAVNQETGLITLYGGFQRLIGNDIVMDANRSSCVARLNNGKLAFVTHNAQKDDPSEDAALMNDFAAYNDSLGIDTLFVLAPQKISKYSDDKPAGVVEFGNENSDEFLALLASAGTDALDLREAFQSAAHDHAYYFFNTDHHWKPEGAFLAFQNIADCLREGYGFTIDPAVTDLESYKTITYEDIFLGSQGKRVGPLYAGVDDLTLLLPKEETDGFTFSIPHKNVVRSGSFEDAYLFYEMIERRDYYNLNPYAVYTGGDYPLSIMTNENDATGGKKILLLRQSYSCALAPFLSRACGTLDIIDPRYYEGSIRDYIAETQPDLVMMVYGASDTCNELLFEPLNR